MKRVICFGQIKPQGVMKNFICLEKYDCTDPEGKRINHVHIWRRIQLQESAE